MTIRQRLRFKIIRLLNYEFWPYYIFYFPMLFYGLYLALRAKSLCYFSTTNPCMKYGGIMGESKYKILKKINPKWIPITLLIKKGLSFKEVVSILKGSKLSYPLIAKPDIGERGIGVEMIDDEKSLEKYFEQIQDDFIIQEFIGYENEIGVFYYRFPDKEKGNISSIVQKGFLYVTGDGTRTLEQLITNELRAFSNLDYFKKKYSSRLGCIPEKGEKILLEPIGNHNRGTTFLNGERLINNKLIDQFDEIAKSITGFYYGRFDLKVKSIEDLYEGKNLKIMELNGVSSEPAHVYDPNYKLLKAYRDIAFQMKVIYRISEKNHRLGFKRDSFFQLLKDARHHLSESRKKRAAIQS